MFDDRPAHPGLLIYDGDCTTCANVARLLARVVPSAPAVSTYQSVDIHEFGLSVSDAKKRVWLVTPTETLGGYLAISGMLRHQPDSALRFAGWLIATPPWSLGAALGYAVFARAGHRAGRREVA